MKNKILLLIIAIFSFALYVGKVEADDSGCYTCLSLGEVSWGEKPSRQCPNGEWELNSDIKKEKKCVFDCSDKESCEKVNWLARCEYKQMAVNNNTSLGYINLYFNNSIMKFFINNNLPDDNIKMKIKLKELLKEYEKRKTGETGCPKYIYYNYSKFRNDFGSSSIFEYTLSSDGVDISDTSDNDKYQDKIYKLIEEKENGDSDNEVVINNCEDLIGSEGRKLINTLMKWMRIAVPILLIVFGIIDFATALFSSKEDDMKKKRETFIKRIIAAVLVFLAPILVNLLLDIANDVWNWINPDTCLK